MKIKAKVLATKNDKGELLAKIKCNGRLPPVGAIIEVRFGSKRTLQQNAFLWAYYTWLIKNAGLADHGFFCPEAIHSSLKIKFVADKIMEKGEWKAIEEGTTTMLSKLEFSNYMEKIDHFICEFFEIDTSAFFQEYEDIYKPNWK